MTDFSLLNDLLSISDRSNASFYAPCQHLIEHIILIFVTTAYIFTIYIFKNNQSIKI